MRNRYSNEIVFIRSLLIFIGLSILLIVSGCGSPRRTANPGPGNPPQWSPPAPPPPKNYFPIPDPENYFPIPPFLEREEPVLDPNLSPIENQFEMLRTYKFGMETPALDALEFFLDNLDDEEILAELRIVAEGDDPFQRMFASFVLFKAGDEQEKRVDVFIEGMQTMMGDEIRCAQYLTENLLEPGDDPVFIEKLLTLQSHPNWHNRTVIVTLAAKFPDAEGVRECLLNSLDAPDGLGATAIYALGEALSNTSIYPNDPEIIQRFYNHLNYGPYGPSTAALTVLSRFISVDETLELIDEIMKSETEFVPNKVNELLINLGPPDKVNQFLVDRIDENNTSLSISIIGIISRRGENAASAVPALVELLSPRSSGDFIVVLPRDDPLRDSVIRALGSIGPPAEEAVPILGSMFTIDFDLSNMLDPDYSFTSSIIYTLSSIGGTAVEYLPPIVEVAQTSDGSLRVGAIDAIGRFGEQAEPWVPELLEIVEELKSKRPADYMDQAINPGLLDGSKPHCDATYINRVYLALYRIGYEPDVQFDSIIAELDGPDFMYAVAVLVKIGPPAIIALPKLRELSEKYEEDWRDNGLTNQIRIAIEIIQNPVAGYNEIF